MKALIYHDVEKLSLDEVPRPQIGAKDVLVKVMRAGICGSDITAYLYDGQGVGILKKGQFGHDGQFGHEMSGLVVEVGQDVEDISVGERVFVNPTRAKKMGMMSCDICGGFSEYVTVENAKYDDNLFKLADTTSYDEGVLMEPLSVGTHAKNLIKLKPEENAVIFGAGPIGLLTLASLIAMGCENPVVIDLNEDRLAIAKQMGAKTINSAKVTDLETELIAHFGEYIDVFGRKKANVDGYFECSGAGVVVKQILALAKDGSRLAIVAVHKQPLTDFDITSVTSNQLTIKGIRGYTLADVKEAVACINDHKVDVTKVISHHFKHNDSIEAFELAANPKVASAKVIIDYE